MTEKILEAAPMTVISTISTRGDDTPADDANSLLSILVKKIDKLIRLQRESTSN